MEAKNYILPLLEPFGLTANHLCVAYLARAVEIVSLQPEKIHAIRKCVCEVIAEEFGVEGISIDSGLRRLASAAWRTDPDYLSQLAGRPLTKCPSTVQLIEIFVQLKKHSS